MPVVCHPAWSTNRLALIAKYQRRFPDFDDKIVSMYARGMTVREIRGHLEELYGIEVSPNLISTVTDAVLEEVGEWQNRPLDGCDALVFFDAIRELIEEVRLVPENGKLRIERFGELAALIYLANEHPRDDAPAGASNAGCGGRQPTLIAFHGTGTKPRKDTIQQRLKLTLRCW